MNDACCLNAGRFGRSVKLPRHGGNRLFGRGISETSRIMRRTNEGKDKMNGDKGAALEGLAVTQPIMSMRRKDKGIWSVGKLKGQMFWGQLKRSTVVVKYLKVDLDMDFFPGKTCKPFACKRNYFVLQSETATFACWRKRNVECINVIKWTMLKGNYFVFSCVLLTVRVFNFPNLCSCWMFFSIFLWCFPLWVINVVHKQLAIQLFKYL